MDKPHNPPAFPVPGGQLQSLSGMTLRDWFAGELAPSVFKGLVDSGSDMIGFPAKVAKDSYLIADAMLAERQKGNDDE